jgi:hypothetical protein
MILDYEQELSAAGGQLFNASDGNSEYGSKPYDLKATSPGDPAVGEPLDVFAQVDDANSDVGTSYDIAVVNDTDGAGTSEVSLVSRTILVAALLLGTTHFIGRIAPHLASKRYLTAKVTTHGGTPTTGKMKIWLQKSGDGIPVNAGFAA